jgi:signal transduction histidine kinase
MSHELRTLLNAIMGFSEVLTDRMFGELNEKQEEYLKDMFTVSRTRLSRCYFATGGRFRLATLLLPMAIYRRCG